MLYISSQVRTGTGPHLPEIWGFITPFKKPQGGELLDWQKEFNAQVNRLRAPVERAIAHLESWRILHTDYRRPLRTYATSYRAAVGLYFFKLNFG